jgi:hypothetical protein
MKTTMEKSNTSRHRLARVAIITSMTKMGTMLSTEKKAEVTRLVKRMKKKVLKATKKLAMTKAKAKLLNLRTTPKVTRNIPKTKLRKVLSSTKAQSYTSTRRMKTNTMPSMAKKARPTPSWMMLRMPLIWLLCLPQPQTP